jgi:hypothetical protein
MRAFLFASVLCCLLSFSALSPAENAAAPDLQDGKYYSCHAATDCAAANAPCGGFEAVNKEYLKEIQEWFDGQAASVKCRQPPPDRPQVEALHCNEGRCALEMTEPAEPAGQKSAP